MRKLAIALTAAALTALAVPAAAQVESDKPITTLSVAEVRALAVETGGVPGEVEPLEGGDYRMEIRYPDGVPVQFEGWSCTGEGEAKRCAEFEMHVWFIFESEAEALTWEHDVHIAWLSDLAIGKDLKVWRMDYLAGMTRGRMRGQFETFLNTVNAARDIIYAEDAAK